MESSVLQVSSLITNVKMCSIHAVLKQMSIAEQAWNTTRYELANGLFMPVHPGRKESGVV